MSENKHKHTIDWKQKRTPPKFIRDPIHDIIKIEDEIILKVLDTEPMQRLRHIRQLGVASLVFPGAEHSRFSHSIGVYHLSRKMLNQLGVVEKDDESQYDRIVVQLAALLHDTGHGPFSHLFEAVMNDAKYSYARNHEDWTKKLIMEHPQLTRILDKSLRSDVKDVIDKDYQKRRKWLSAIVSSQFDADRFDYMLRDSFMTGVNYGRFDLNWVLRNLSVEKVMVEEFDEDDRKMERSKEVIAISARRGLSSLEEYLLGNLNLYEHVYYHKTVQAAEAMLRKALLRAIDLLKDSDPERRTLVGVKSCALDAIAANREIAISEYCELNDNVVLSWLTSWAQSSADKILKNLSSDLLNRQLFKAVEVKHLRRQAHTDAYNALTKALESKTKASKYYLTVSDPTRVAYESPFTGRRSLQKEEIYYLGQDGNVRRYSEVPKERRVSRAIVEADYENYFFIVPPWFEKEAKIIVKQVGGESK